MTWSDPTPPLIPAELAARPTVGGLVVPAITPRMEDGRFLFGTIERSLADRAIKERRCGVCWHELEDPCVLLMRVSDLPRECTSEPALHPVCKDYTVDACPMVAGRMQHYRRSLPKLDATAIRESNSEARLGDPAEPWYAVWVRDYDVTQDNGPAAASYAGREPIRTRLLGRYGEVLRLLQSPTEAAPDGNTR